MKLTELDAKFYALPGRPGMGLLFRVPGTECDLVAIPFANPLDGGEPEVGRGAYWTRTGETIDTLTLHPSVNVLAPNPWHGWIRNGEAVSC